MTGFTNFLRKICCLPPKQDYWEEARKSRSLLIPAKIKVAVRNERQIEYKIDYLVSPGLAKQVYDVSLYFFFSSDLDAAEVSFFRSLYGVVRLHTPKTNVRDLTVEDGASSGLGALAASIQVVKAKLASGQDIDSDATHLVYQLQLYACTFRRAVRRTVKDILQALLGSEDPLPSQPAECRAAAAICELLDASDAAIHALKKVCGDCEDAKMPNWLREAWHLVEELVLLEEHVTLLKLAVKLDAIYQSQSASQIDHPSQGGLPCVQDYQDCSDSVELRRHRQALQAQALDCLAESARSAVQVLEGLARERGYSESLLHSDSPTENEEYTNRVKILKRHAQLAITLAPRMLRRSMLVDDIVGMTIAGLAMAFALLTMYWAFRSSAQFGIIYIAIYIIGYMFKDRIKEWGKRYLQPIAEWFGIDFPDRVQKFRDYFGKAVGSCSERVRIKDGLDVSPRVLRMRYAGHKSGPPTKRHLVKPERVLIYTKKMEVRWRDLEAGLQGVRSLDDVIRIDLHFLCRAMQPPHETHYALARDARGWLGVSEVETARVYHVNSILELRTQGPNPEKAMQLEKMRIVMDRSGIKRLEPCGDDAVLAKERCAEEMRFSFSISFH
ncbi:hypothetical protein WJX75_000938 [Coccomyxa subellipsoidea]|uniref:Uncharacterized protein n=1 Tax=Coccomyxa subellipsoidea TaxID=248742 RepID=A0ABR2YK97_9CHLO